MKWTVEQKSGNVHLIRIPYGQVGWEQRVLLSSDRHHDNPGSDWSMEKRHLDEARTYGAPIVDVGDLFCAMQGKYDRRSDKSHIRPEHQTNRYLDALVDEAASFYGPYSDLFAVLGRGNHDQAIVKNHETDLISRLAGKLASQGGPPYAGGYRGWVRFMFEREDGSGGRQSISLFYTHGAGGGGPVTKGVIKTNRRATYLPDADIVVSGHIHESWYLEIPRFRLSSGHKLYKDTQYHVQIPTYKDEMETGAEGWANEREMPPKPLGAWWMRFYLQGGRVRVKFERAT